MHKKFMYSICYSIGSLFWKSESCWLYSLVTRTAERKTNTSLEECWVNVMSLYPEVLTPCSVDNQWVFTKCLYSKEEKGVRSQFTSIQRASILPIVIFHFEPYLYKGIILKVCCFLPYMDMHACNLSTWDSVAGGLGGWSWLMLYSKIISKK